MKETYRVNYQDGDKLGSSNDFQNSFHCTFVQPLPFLKKNSKSTVFPESKNFSQNFHFFTENCRGNDANPKNLGSHRPIFNTDPKIQIRKRNFYPNQPQKLTVISYLLDKKLILVRLALLNLALS